MYSLTFLYGFSALTQSTNSSSASIATGVRSFQLKGMPVASGVVNRFDSVMMILWGLFADALTSRKPSPPAPPALLITTIGCFIKLCLVTMPWMVRAIWSAPPPVPAGTMNSTGRTGSQAADAMPLVQKAATVASATRNTELLMSLSQCVQARRSWPALPSTDSGRPFGPCSGRLYRRDCACERVAS